MKSKIIEIVNDKIELQQFLKLANLISTGGEAKHFLANNKIICNGVLENRRKHKLVPGDQIEVNSEMFVIKKI